MKATVFALVALIVGVATGISVTQHEFSREVIPVEIDAPGNGTATGKIGPKVTIVNGERYDFGTMERNAHGKHEFIVRNDGDAPLTLQPGATSCSVCVKVFAVEKGLLGPGEKTVVDFEWDVKTSDTEFEQSGQLNTNATRNTVTLYIKGHVLDNVRLDRSDIHFHDLLQTDSATGGVNIFAFKEPAVTVEKHEFSDPSMAKHFSVSFNPLSADDLSREPKAKSGLKMLVEVKPGLPYGDFSETVSVFTSHSPDPLTVRIIGNIASDIVLMGQNFVREKSLVSLGAVSQSVGKKQTIFLIVKGPHRDDTKIELETSEPASEFTARLGEPIHDSAKTIRYPIVIEVPPGAKPVTRMEGTYAHVHVTTTHPDVKEIDIKARYVVKE